VVEEEQLELLLEIARQVVAVLVVVVVFLDQYKDLEILHQRLLHKEILAVHLLALEPILLEAEAAEHQQQDLLV